MLTTLLSYSLLLSLPLSLCPLLPTVRCPHHCRSNTSCQQFSRCVLVLSEPGPETTTGPVRSHVTMATAAQSSASVLTPEEEPRSGHADLKAGRGVSSSKQVRRRANEDSPEVPRLRSWTGSSEEVQQEAAGPQRPGSRSRSESGSGPPPVTAEKKKQPLR